MKDKMVWSEEERKMVFQLCLDKQGETIEVLCDLLSVAQEEKIRELLENILDKLSCMSYQEFYQFMRENKKYMGLQEKDP